MALKNLDWQKNPLMRFSVTVAACVSGVLMLYGSVQTAAAQGAARPTEPTAPSGASNIQAPGKCGRGGGTRATGEPIKVLSGRYGPYIKHGATNANVPRGTDPQDVTLDQAVLLLAERAAKGGGKKKGGRTAKAKAAPKAAAAKPPAKKTAAKKKPASKKKAPAKKAATA